ncbi:helix-turn-helix domain-containing protein [Streptomyces physcomitrii]|uniref:Helix-turn-helix domain-containing protein n=1 Tax=Streptomyces physcomitrii TaxID=2724184 RepID=A0ABX1GZG6_9ACTN|nr:helix-turn-helix transcriptional regulator [Streptomyces physcomitrii]NKI41481.1 helix-turn-helix domain-containing protein [Streptomyces physcomitrii]
MNKSALGSALRALRVSSGLEAKAVARGAAMSRSKLSKIENGNVAPSLTDVDSVLTVIGVSEEVKAEYMAAAREAATEVTAWRLFRRLGYSRKQQQVQSLEARTALLRLFQPSLIPGLLQTPEYVRAVFEPKDLTDGQLESTISARLARQSVLYAQGKDFQFLITESVLRWLVVPPLVMVGQLDRLLSLSRLPNVDIRVVALSVPQKDFAGHSFCLFDDRTVTVETVHAEIVVTDPRDVALYVSKFERFRESAVSGDAMRALVESIRDGYLREQETG